MTDDLTQVTRMTQQQVADLFAVLSHIDSERISAVRRAEIAEDRAATFQSLAHTIFHDEDADGDTKADAVYELADRSVSAPQTIDDLGLDLDDLTVVAAVDDARMVMHVLQAIGIPMGDDPTIGTLTEAARASGYRLTVQLIPTTGKATS